MSRSKKNNNGSISEYRNLLLAVSFILIIAGLVGGITSSIQKKKNNSKTFPLLNFPENLNIFQKPDNSKKNILNVLSASATSILDVPSPTPTPLSTFRQNKFQFSFEVPNNATVRETDPNQTILVANSGGGAFIEIPEKLQVEIAVVKLLGLNIDKYYANRLAMIFDETIQKTQESTESANQKKYEIKLRKNDTLQDETLILLPFRGDQIFEIQAIFQNPNHVKEDKILDNLIKSLKPY